MTDTIKKIKKTSRNSKTKATLAPPITTAGSSCGDGVALMQVNVYAFGANGSEIIEWFASQSSATPIYTGSVYSPSISSTKTYYVRSRSGGDVSTRVPVVASIYVVPPAVTLTASPQNNTSSPLCFGTTVTFTASGGADLFEFSVDGVVMQGMSTSRVFTTNTLSDGQVVKVRTRYAVVLDGSITEMAWGTGVLEDNFLSAALSVNASTGYVNSFKISALEDKVVLGIAGKVLSNRSILLFLDTKSGGFNVSDFGNEADNDPAVKAFNMFNNSSSTFDSYFLADYCLVISTDATSTNYYANVIELKSGVSVKTFLGSTASGFPSAVMGVDKNNTGINDYSRGFEVEVLKSLLGYTTGDIKFFALTMNDKEDGSQSVTNSFLSPERSSNLDYGKAAIDYNFKDPNPVVVASAALIPCYSESNITMNFVSTPSVSSITQPTCAVQTGTIYITAQPGVYYSIDGTVYQNSNMFSGLLPGNYNLFVKKISDNTCALSSAIPAVINAIPTPPVVPTAANVVQPTCGGPSGSIVITTQTGTEYSLNGTTYQVSNTFSGLTPGNYTMFVRNTADTICVISSESAIIINAIPTPPAVPTSLNVTQPTCGAPSGSISIITQSGVEYSLNGTTYQSSNTFPGLAPNNYTLYVRNTADNICVTPSSGAITINAIPTPPVVPTTDSVIQPTCATPSGSILITTQTGVEYSLNGTMYQSSNTFSGLAPNNYTLYVRSTGDNTCLKSSATMTTINAVPTPPVVATTASVVQPTCATPSGSISITTQTGVEYSLNGTTYQSSNTFSGLALNNYTLYVRNIADNTCSIQSTASVTVNPLPLLPSTPTLVRVTQPTCFVPSGSIEIATQADVQYSVGSGYQNSAVFNNLAPGKYTISVRFTNSITCITLGSETIINAIPPQIQFETIADCENKEYTLTANPLLRSYDPNNVSYQWKDKVGNIVGTNSNVLNVTDVIALKPSGQVVFPVTYTLTVSSLNTGCETSSDVIVESVYCNIQKGISPDGNGSNDFFDLRLMNVKKLEIFNRYGVKVYSQNNYSDQWNGQTSKGEDLPSATYYYVIEFNSGEPKTGWIYLIREKH
ncbi:MAG: gliding motility-associated C-terminal domain-containing protein [Oligoflexus sp.]|nr:gliding motility-associated C-terminal domain-containing protein [Pseudopedobacter sp.]